MDRGSAGADGVGSMNDVIDRVSCIIAEVEKSSGEKLFNGVSEWAKISFIRQVYAIGRSEGQYKVKQEFADRVLNGKMKVGLQMGLD